MVVALIALSIFRVLVSLQAKQFEYFSVVGGELELIYRQVWYEPSQNLYQGTLQAQVANPFTLVRQIGRAHV